MRSKNLVASEDHDRMDRLRVVFDHALKLDQRQEHILSAKFQSAIYRIRALGTNGLCRVHDLRFEVAPGPCAGGFAILHGSAARVYLQLCDGLDCPYVHEIAHLAYCSDNSQWLSEGVACCINDSLGGDPSSPNFGLDPDVLLRTNQLNPPLSEVADHISKCPDWFFDLGSRGRVFALACYSFTRYLVKMANLRQLAETLFAPDPAMAIESSLGSSLAELKSCWIDSLK